MDLLIVTREGFLDSEYPITKEIEIFECWRRYKLAFRFQYYTFVILDILILPATKKALEKSGAFLFLNTSVKYFLILEIMVLSHLPESNIRI
jgi:hypothetical protein